MVDIIVWLSIGFFLLLPYYHAVFTFNERTVGCHISFWLCAHFIFAIIFTVIEKALWTVPLILFCAYTVYFVFSYIFYVRDMCSNQEKSNIQSLIATKWFVVAERIVFIVSTTLLIADISLLGIQMMKGFDLGLLYLTAVIIVSYAQLVFLIKRFTSQ